MTQELKTYYGAFHRKGRLSAQAAFRAARYFATYRPNGHKVKLSSSTALVPAGFWGGHTA